MMKRLAVIPDIVPGSVCSRNERKTDPGIVAGVTMFGFVILSGVRSTKSKDLVK